MVSNINVINKIEEWQMQFIALGVLTAVGAALAVVLRWNGKKLSVPAVIF